ncbi:MAG: S8 family serine peptidase [Phycisphaerae bacterium]
MTEIALRGFASCVLTVLSYAAVAGVADNSPVSIPADAAYTELSDVRVSWWHDGADAFYAIAREGKSPVVRNADYRLLLRRGSFDPLDASIATEALLQSAPDAGLQIVQFHTQPLPEYRTQLEQLGVTLHHYVGNYGFIASMGADQKAAVAALPFVRWSGPYHAEYRLEDFITDNLFNSDALRPAARYNIQIAGRGLDAKMPIVDAIQALGGTIEALPASSFLLEATLTPEQLLEIVHRDDVIFIDRWLPPTTYMDNVREVGGANYVETVAGYDGTGVRGEAMDSNLIDTHPDFQLHPPIFHGSHSGSASHGTSVFGIVFGSGANNAAATGVIPEAQGIFADFSFLPDRYAHIQSLKQPPYEAVFQTNSWGSCCTTQYGTAAAFMDEILFDHDFLLLQAQANNGSQSSDQSAFAKNCVSVGGIRHFNTLNLADDAWNNAGSIGPASDGRIKPDLAFWYDSILTTSSTGGYTSGFGGTSAATPMTAGFFGLFYQMWNDGIFGNDVDPLGTVFENAPHMSTAKAMMINSANPYPFVGASADLTRTHQGWGRADVRNLYDLRETYFVIDESEILENLDVATYPLEVSPGTASFRATLVYADPPGVPSSSRHRVNDLTLHVVSPSGLEYWGNNGLTTGNESVSGGAANVIDTVENVWLTDPEAGTWTVEVRADEIVQDGHVETPGLDVDFALVVSGVTVPTDLLGDMNCDGVISIADIGPFVLALTDPTGYALQFPDCDVLRGDLNADDLVTVSDIGLFVALVGG